MFKKSIKTLFTTGIFILSFMALFSAHWYITVFGKVGFRSILFTLLSSKEGTAGGIVSDWLLKGLMPSVICGSVLSTFYYANFNLKPFIKKAICIILCSCLWIYGIFTAEIPTVVIGTFSKTDIYEQSYANPSTTKITFPKEKRNLIYIILESMETTYFSKDQGGALEQNVIPKLYNLAKENTNFSHNNDVGGWGYVTNTSWTSASLVAQTSGVPLSMPLLYTVPKNDSNFLPNIITIGDILHQNGYNQTVMFGSVASYGSRENHFAQHGIDKILDYNTAKQDGIIPKDYHVWWGMEDSKLIEYAKLELTNLSKEDKPFSFTMLTADTHHISGYICDKCKNNYHTQYENVLNCSSEQIYEFVEWIKTQPFYENTSIIVIGDHLTMDAQFISDNTEKGYSRHVYNCFINPSSNTNNLKNRVFTPMDIMPTTLASIGCEIEGERLGLGTNLFSDKKTLAEEIGLKKLNTELNKSSKYYLENFIK